MEAKSLKSKVQSLKSKVGVAPGLIFETGYIILRIF
jgi:hypothetical protein